MAKELNSPQRVVITGAGNISSLGNDWKTVRESFLSMKNAVRTMPEWDKYPDLKTRLAAPIDNFELPEHYRARARRRMGRVSSMAVLASEYALIDAGLLGDEILASGDVGISYGSATGSTAAGMEFFKMLSGQGMGDVNTTTYIRMMSHTAAVNIGVHFGIQGRMYTTSSACTAGSQGIGYAYETICAGKQKIMLAGGAEELCPSQATVFDILLAASTNNEQPEKSPRPFDKNRDGLVLGEGASTLILESYDHAIARGANILAEVIGYATNTDGAHIVKPKQETMQKVIELAVKDANISPDQIGFVSAHATATNQGDIFESHATHAVVGRKPVNSIKSYTGHSLGACGAFELWSSINMMREGWFAPTLNLDTLDENCAPLDYIQGEPREIKTNMIMSNNFAFGGINTSIIVQGPELI